MSHEAECYVYSAISETNGVMKVGSSTYQPERVAERDLPMTRRDAGRSEPQPGAARGEK
jgi:hypothetical protein